MPPAGISSAGGGDERGLLARVALGRGVGDVVAGRVEQPLLGEEPAQRGLEAVEGGDRHRVTPGGRGRGGQAGAGGRGGAGAGPAGVAGLGVLADEAGQVREERELLAHQRAVDAVLAGDLGQQAAQLGGALARGAAAPARHERAQALERDLGGGDAERGAGALQQRARGPARGRRGGPSRSGSRRGARGRRRRRARGSPCPARARAEQAARGGDLRVEVDEQLGLEDRCSRRRPSGARGRAGRRGPCRRWRPGRR